MPADLQLGWSTTTDRRERVRSSNMPMATNTELRAVFDLSVIHRRTNDANQVQVEKGEQV